MGTIVQALVLVTLSGRSPLYRLADFFKHQDTELLLGHLVAESVADDCWEEVFILCGRNVLGPKGIPGKITKEDILRKYGATLE